MNETVAEILHFSERFQNQNSFQKYNKSVVGLGPPFLLQHKFLRVDVSYFSVFIMVEFGNDGTLYNVYDAARSNPRQSTSILLLANSYFTVSENFHIEPHAQHLFKPSLL